MNFFSYDLIPFLCEDPLPLSYRKKGWGDVKLMDHNPWVYPQHILMAPGEDV